MDWVVCMLGFGKRKKKGPLGRNSVFPNTQLKIEIPHATVLHAHQHAYLFRNVGSYLKPHFAPVKLAITGKIDLNLNYEAPRHLNEPGKKSTALDSLLPLSLSLQDSESTLSKNFLSPLLYAQPRSEEWKNAKQLIQQAMKIQQDLDISMRNQTPLDPTQFLHLISLLDALTLALAQPKLQSAVETLKSHYKSQSDSRNQVLWEGSKKLLQILVELEQFPETTGVPGTTVSGVPGTVDGLDSGEPGTTVLGHDEDAEEVLWITEHAPLLEENEHNRRSGKGVRRKWYAGVLKTVSGLFKKHETKEPSAD